MGTEVMGSNTSFSVQNAEFWLKVTVLHTSMFRELELNQ